jgi:hypothetical protein
MAVKHFEIISAQKLQMQKKLIKFNNLLFDVIPSKLINFMRIFLKLRLITSAELSEALLPTDPNQSINAVLLN